MTRSVGPLGLRAGGGCPTGARVLNRGPRAERAGRSGKLRSDPVGASPIRDHRVAEGTTIGIRPCGPVAVAAPSRGFPVDGGGPPGLLVCPSRLWQVQEIRLGREGS